jgi:metal-responsive CopG/Arc/MetJ family transcriptional regulator
LAYDLVEDFNKEAPVATVNFSVPDDVKREFQEAFAGENKSAVIARLMRQAVEERRRQRRRAVAIDALLELRQQQHPATDEEITAARRAVRP